MKTECLPDSVKEQEILEQKIGKTDDTGMHDRFDIAVVGGPECFIGDLTFTVVVLNTPVSAEA